MINILARIRVWLLMLTLAVVAAPAGASGRQSTAQTRTTEATHTATQATTESQPPAGSPEFGVLIIIGVVAFLVFVAWLFTRVGDDSGTPTDRTMP